MKNKFFILIFLFINFTLIAQNDLYSKKIDSLTEKIGKCLNCSREYYMRANLYIKEKKHMEAMLDLNKAIEIHSKYFKKYTYLNIELTKYYNSRAKLKMDLEDYRGAIQDFEKAISVNVGYDELWSEIFFYKGYCENKIGKYEESIIDYKKVLSFFPDDRVALYNIGLNYISLGDKEKGCKFLSRAGELGFEDAYLIISRYCQ